MLQAIETFISKRPNDAELALKHQQYAENAYPSNHAYKITKQRLLPKRKLAVRYKQIAQLYPEKFESLADIGCSKGYFNFAAAQQSYCKRSLGIDVVEECINHCLTIKNYLGSKNTQFSLLKLHELSESIHEFGGPFQVVLVINLYQYLYFGSDYSSACYLNHDEIFKCLRKICSGRIIFNNRITTKDAQNKERILMSGEHAKDYTEEKIIEAASKYFAISKHGKIGRYPLWALDAR
jgi:hypothetical protein